MIRTLLAASALLLAELVAPAGFAQTSDQAPANYPVVLHAAEAAKYFPATVYFRGQSAPVQERNSGGVQFAKESLMMAALVDTSGYSSQVQQKYQAYLITETPLEIDGHRLAPGAYGVGFLANDTFVVMDLGNHDLFTAHSEKDAGLRRPTPLQVLADPVNAHAYRLYEGRTYVGFRQAEK